LCGNTLGINALGGQEILNSLGPIFGQRLIDGIRTGTVGVTVNHHIGIGVFNQSLGELRQSVLGRFAQDGFASLEEDTRFEGNLDTFTNAFYCCVFTQLGFKFSGLFVHFLANQGSGRTTNSSTCNGTNSYITKQFANACPNGSTGNCTNSGTLCGVVQRLATAKNERKAQ